MIFRFLVGNLEFAEVKPKIEQLMSQYTSLALAILRLIDGFPYLHQFGLLNSLLTSNSTQCFELNS